MNEVLNKMTPEQQSRALHILDNMALENRKPWWAFWRRRWFISDEPLRIDAANLLEDLGYYMPQPKGTRRVRPGVELGLLHEDDYDESGRLK